MDPDDENDLVYELLTEVSNILSKIQDYTEKEEMANSSLQTKLDNEIKSLDESILTLKGNLVEAEKIRDETIEDTLKLENEIQIIKTQ